MTARSLLHLTASLPTGPGKRRLPSGQKPKPSSHRTDDDGCDNGRLHAPLVFCKYTRFGECRMCYNRYAIGCHVLDIGCACLCPNAQCACHLGRTWRWAIAAPGANLRAKRIGAQAVVGLEWARLWKGPHWRLGCVRDKEMLERCLSSSRTR